MDSTRACRVQRKNLITKYIFMTPKQLNHIYVTHFQRDFPARQTIFMPSYLWTNKTIYDVFVCKQCNRRAAAGSLSCSFLHFITRRSVAPGTSAKLWENSIFGVNGPASRSNWHIYYIYFKRPISEMDAAKCIHFEICPEIRWVLYHVKSAFSPPHQYKLVSNIGSMGNFTNVSSNGFIGI